MMGATMRIELKASALGLFAIMWASFAVLLGWPRGVCMAVIISACVLLHEYGHAHVARCCGLTVKAIGISLKGAYTVRERSRLRRVEALATLAGPAVNLALGFVFAAESGKMHSWLAGCNFVLAISNLIPIGPTDGMRILRLFTSAR